MRPELESQHRETTDTFMLLCRALADVFGSRQVQKLSRGQSCLAEIPSAGIKPLPALAALSTKKKKKPKTKLKPTNQKTSKNQPAFVSHLLFIPLVSSVCVGSTFQGLTGHCFTQSPVQGLQPQPSKPSSGTSPSWSPLQGACHHLSHLPKEKGCPICPEPIQLEEFEPKC